MGKEEKILEKNKTPGEDRCARGDGVKPKSWFMNFYLEQKNPEILESQMKIFRTEHRSITKTEDK